MNTADIGKKSRTGVYWSLGLKLLHQLYHFGVLIVVARILGPSDFGLMALAMAIILFANHWTGCGFTQSIVQAQTLSEPEVRAVLTCNLGLSLLMAALLVTYGDVLAAIFDMPKLVPVLRPLALLFPLTSFYHVRTAMLRREMNFRLHSAMDFLMGVVQSTTTLVMALWGYGVFALVAGQLVGTAVATLALMAATRWMPRLTLRLQVLRRMVRYASMDLVRTQIRYLEEYASSWIIAYSLGSTALGFFERAQSVAFVPLSRIQIQTDAVLFSAYSRLQSDPRHLTHVFRRSFTAVALTGVPLLVGLMAVAPHFVLVSLGEKWAPMIVPLQLLALASLFRMLSSTTRCLNVAGNAYARQTAVSVVAVALYALFCVVGLRWGIEGVAVGTLLASVLTFFLFAQLALGLLEARWSLFSSVLLPILAGGGAMGAVVYTLSKTLCADYHALNLALLVLAGIAVYGAWFLWIPHEGIQEVRTRVGGDLRTALGMIRPLPSGGEGDIS